MLALYKIIFILYIFQFTKSQEGDRERNFKHKPKCKVLPGVYRTLDYFEACGFIIESVLDIGANSGEWSKLLKTYFPNIKSVFLIEASDAHAEALKQSGALAISFIL